MLGSSTEHNYDNEISTEYTKLHGFTPHCYPPLAEATPLMNIMNAKYIKTNIPTEFSIVLLTKIG